MNELDEIDVTFIDKVIKLKNNNILIARCMLFEDETLDKIPYLTMHSPMQVWNDYDGKQHLTKWIPESDDDIFTLHLNNIINISTPEKMLGIRYNNGFMFESDEHTEFTTNLIADVIH